MKVYTEIVYTWDEEKGQLVEESSKSFEYEGPVSQCHDKYEYVGPKRFNNKVRVNHSHSPTYEDAQDAMQDLGEGMVADTVETGLSTLLTNVENTHDSLTATTDAGKDFLENQTNINPTIAAGPGGSFADVANAVYGGSFKDAVESTQDFYRDFEGGVRYYADKIGSRGRTDSSGGTMYSEEDGSGEGEGDITPEERESLLVQGLAGGRGSTTPGGSKGYRGRSFHQKKGTATILAPSTGLVTG